MAIANSNSNTLAEFYAWNPVVCDDCQTLQPKYYVCVGQASVTSSRPVSTTPTENPVCSWNPSKSEYDCLGLHTTPTPSPTNPQPPATLFNAGGHTFQLQQVGDAENWCLLLRYGGCSRHYVGRTLSTKLRFK